MNFKTIAILALAAGFPASAALASDFPGLRPEQKLPRTAEYDYEVPEPGTYQLPRIMPAGDGVVLGTEGERQSLRALMTGRISVLSFIYTRCPDPRACPMATGALRKLHAISREDRQIADELILLSMSFDPAIDTPQVMKTFAMINRQKDDGAPWQFLTTPSKATLEPILEAYGQVIDRRRNDPAKRIYHPVRVYLVDRQGMIRNIYSFGLLDPRMVMTDIRTLLLEESKRAASE